MTKIELIELIEQQGDIIKELSTTVARLLLQNSEQEMLIEELIKPQEQA